MKLNWYWRDNCSPHLLKHIFSRLLKTYSILYFSISISISCFIDVFDGKFPFLTLIIPLYISIDFGIDTLMEHAEKTEFPWLMSNVIDNETGRPLAEGKVSHTVDWWGRKVGLVSTLALHNFFFHICSIFYKKDYKTTTSFLPVLFSFYG